MLFSDSFYYNLKLSCYSLKMYESGMTVLYTTERTKWTMIIASLDQETVE